MVTGWDDGMGSSQSTPLFVVSCSPLPCRGSTFGFARPIFRYTRPRMSSTTGAPPRGRTYNSHGMAWHGSSAGQLSCSCHLMSCALVLRIHTPPRVPCCVICTHEYTTKRPDVVFGYRIASFTAFGCPALPRGSKLVRARTTWCSS